MVEMMLPKPSTDICCDPIFILGIMTRSGTNFFYNLLCLHPQCCGISTRTMPEDQLLSNSNLLLRYANNVVSYWNKHGRRGKNEPDLEQMNHELQSKLFASMGEGLLTYLNSLNPQVGQKPLVTKTPNVRNLQNFFKLFPKARLLILIRDGRAVVESNVKSFGYDYESAMQRWAAAARTILEFDNVYKNSEFKYLIVKYEDIVDNLQNELSRVFDFLGLDATSYGFEQALALPVFGSSENFNQDGNNHGTKHNSCGWKIVEKNPEFKPKTRWKHWSQARHCRFNWIAGDYMTQLGYEPEVIEREPLLSTLQNQIADQQWRLVSWFMSTINYWEKTLYAMTQLKRDFRNLKME